METNYIPPSQYRSFCRETFRIPSTQSKLLSLHGHLLGYRVMTSRSLASLIKSARVFIFDMDGLLLDTERMGLRAWQSVVGHHGLDIDDIFPSLIGKGAAEADRILAEHFGPSVSVPQLRVEKNVLFADMLAKGVQVKEGARDLLTHLSSRGAPTALATSTTRAEALLRLASAKLTHTFDTQVFRDDVARSKPAPDLFLRALELLEHPPEECLVLEDSHAGVEAAIAAKIPVVMVPDLVAPQEWIYGAGAVVVDSLAHVLRCLKNTADTAGKDRASSG
jgi:HAD superfamily hydrolase (TIGR01509 family)